MEKILNKLVDVMNEVVTEGKELAYENSQMRSRVEELLCDSVKNAEGCMGCYKKFSKEISELRAENLKLKGEKQTVVVIRGYGK